MIKWESGCMGCDTPGYPCEGAKCPNHYVPVPYCDDCKEEVEDLYQDGEDQVCEECLKKRHPVIDLSTLTPDEL